MQRIIREEEPAYEAVTSLIKELAARYPFSEVSSCGKSALGRDILSLSVGHGGNYILYIGGVCAAERLTTLALLRFYERLCEAYAACKEIAGLNAREILADRRLIIIPALNPDGIEIALKGISAAGEYKALCENACGGDFREWNANARGVDLSRNYDANWQQLRRMETETGITGPAPRRFCGTRPESEPETKAVTRLCRELPIRHAAVFHSGEEIYWDYGKNTPVKSLLMAKIFAAVTEYTLVKDEGFASYGGFKNWFIGEFSRPAFTVGIGRGENLPLSELDRVYSSIEELLSVGIIM